MRETAKSILILGGGVMQLPAMRIARRMGWKVAVAAREVISEAQALADRVLLADLSDPAAVLDAARCDRRRHGLDGVFTAGTDFSTTAAAVARGLGLPGLPVAVTEDATDKVRMRTLLQRQGVPCPRFLPLRAVADCAAVNGEMPFPLVVKPVDNMGARGVRRVDSRGELEQAVALALQASRSGRALVEEYLEGPELSIDAISFRGRITLCGVADRHIRFPPCFVEMGHTMPTALDEAAVRLAVAVFRRGVRALGIDGGAAKGDVKVTPRGAFIGEIAARLSGGYMSGWTFPFSSGVEVTAAALRVAVGLPPGSMRPVRRWTSAERAFISIPGIVAAVEGADSIDRVEEGEGVREIFYRAAPGQRVVFPANNMEKCGNILSAAPDRERAVELAEEAVRSIFLRLRSGVAETSRFLFHGAPGQLPAFRLERERNRSELSRLPPYEGAVGDRPLRAADLAVAGLPAIPAEPGRDWHGMSLAEALRRVERHTGVPARAAGSGAGAGRGLLLAGLFWKALLAGGVQGGVYLLETLLASERPRDLLRSLAGSRT